MKNKIIMNRRDFSRELGLGAAGLLIASSIPNQLLAAGKTNAAPNLDIVAWHDRTAAQHKQLLDTNAAAGYRTLSLSVYGERNDPRYASVMIKRPVLVAQEQFISLDTAGFQKTFNDMSAKGWGPLIVSATGPASNPLIAAVFHAIKPTPLTRAGITAAELNKLNQQVMMNGGILQWADAYGTPNDMRYIAVWYPNADKAAWNCDAVNDDATTMQARFNALTSGWGRPGHVAVTPAQGILELYVDTQIGAWVSKGPMTSAQYQTEFDTQKSKGLVPVRVSASGSGADARFAAIFAGREEVYPRSFKPSTETPSVSKIDDAVKAVMQANQLRGASLAIVNGTRLVYAKGYSWAEDGYPEVKATTLFRQASVSKMFAAIAAYQLIQQGKQTPDGKKFTLDTPMQSVLQLKTPSGKNPVDNRFGQITIRHLLEMTAGVDAGLIWEDVATKQAFNSQLPVTPGQLASYCASQTLGATPGDKSKATYSNGCYFMLSQVVAKMHNASSFEAAITSSLLQPLGIKRVRGSRTLVGSQASDEVRYHSNLQCINNDCSQYLFPKLQTSTSVVSSDQPMVALGYGETNMENCDGSGGLSAAATDVARVLAALSLRDNNPMLDDATTTAMLANAAMASADPQFASGAHGYHGFDWVGTVDAAKGLYWGYKGGYLSTSQNAIYFERGGWAYAVCWNGNTPNGESWYPKFQSVLDAAKNYDWGNTDLFPKFGMTAFSNLIQYKPPTNLHLQAMPKVKIGSVARPMKP